MATIKFIRGGRWGELKKKVHSFFFLKNEFYKNVEAQIPPKIKNIVVILYVVISLSFSASVLKRKKLKILAIYVNDER